MDAALVFLIVALVAIIFSVLALVIYVLFKYALVFIIAGVTGKLIDKWKK